MKHLKPAADEVAQPEPHFFHPDWQTPNPPLDYAQIERDAMNDLETLFGCWHRDGTPVYDVQHLNPNAEPRRIRQFKFVYTPGALWADLNGVGQGPDLVSVLEFLTQAPRPVCASFLRRRLEAAATHRRPPAQIAPV